MQDNIEWPRDFTEMPLHRGAHPAANTVADNRATDGLAHCETHTRAGSARLDSLAVKSAYIAGKSFLSVVIHSLKIRVPEQS
jgi:hypothetical protein